MPEIGARIRQLRRANKLSQRQLAKYAGISNTEVSRIESGQRRRPAPGILKRLAPHLGVAFPELLKLAGYTELLDVATSTVREGPSVATYEAALRDFRGGELTAAERDKLEEYGRFLLTQRGKKGDEE